MNDLQSLLDEQTEQGELSEEKLGKLAVFTNRYNDLEDEIANIEETLAEKKREMNRLQLNELPDLMDELEIAGMDLPNGKKITVKKIYGGKIAPEVAARAIEHLMSIGREDLIKTQVTRNFAAGELSDAVDFVSELEERGIEASASQSVHSATLRSWIKSMDESDSFDEIPEELFQPGIVRRAVIK